MYNETLEILMEGIDDSIKEQILKNQLEYHFKNKTPENQYAIDNTVTIVRRLLENFNIMDLISVQPIAPWNSCCLTIHNEDKELVRTKRTGMFYNDHSQLNLSDTNGIDMQCEINHAVASELDYLITGEILDYMVKHTGYDSINLTFDISNGIVEFTENVLTVATDINASWIIADVVSSTILSTAPQFEKDKRDKFKLYPAIGHIGSIDGLPVYTSLHISDTIIVGSNDEENPPLIYAPETILKVGEYENNEKRHELLSSSEIFMDLDAVEERYKKINVKHAK